VEQLFVFGHTWAGVLLGVSAVSVAADPPRRALRYRLTVRGRRYQLTVSESPPGFVGTEEVNTTLKV
jgi:hypothetical protein